MNNECLIALGMSRDTLDPMPTEWTSMPLIEAAVRRLRTEIQDHSRAHILWGLNDPAVGILLPIYKHIFQDEGIAPRYVICAMRPPSLAKMASTSGHPNVRQIGSWLFYTLLALHGTKGEDRLVATLKRSLEDPGAKLAEILSAEELAREPEPDEDLEDLNTLPPLVAKTYRLCVQASKDPKALQAGAFDREIDDLYEEFARLTHMIRPPLPPDAPMMFFWMESGQTKQSDKMFSPYGTWQTVSIDIEAPPNTPLQVAPYHMPCEMWVRKAVWRVNGSEMPTELTPGPNGRLETVEGVKRLTIFGPAALLLQTPPTPGALKFEMEFCLQASEGVLENMVAMLSEKLAELTERK